MNSEWKWNSLPKGGGIMGIRSRSTGRCYIVGVSDFRQRGYDHHQKLVKGTHHNVSLQKEWRPDDFEFVVLEVVHYMDYLPIFKQGWIARSEDCFNTRNALPTLRKKRQRKIR